MKRIYVFTDGASRGNPGPAAAAFVVFKDKKLIKKFSQFLGVSTNNIAEYKALLAAMLWLKKTNMNADKINIFLDSELIVKQIKGFYKIKSKNLIPLVRKIKELEQSFKSKISFHWCPREKNRLADSLVNEELDNKNAKSLRRRETR